MMRVILRLVGALLVLAVLAVVGVLMIPAERVAEAAARQFTQLTGRALQIEGSVRPSFWPDLGVRTGPVTVANADWSEGGPMLRADGLQIGVNLAGLFGGEVHVTGLVADKPELLLERAADGRENWVFGGTNGGSVTPSTPGVDAPFSFDRLTIKDGTFSFVDHGADQSWAVSDLSLEAASPSWTGPATLTASGISNGQAVTLTARAESLSDLVSGRVVGVSLAGKAGLATVGFDGRAGLQPMQGAGALNADLRDLSAVAAVLGITPPALRQGFGGEAVTVNGALTYAEDGRIYLRDATFNLDGNALAGAVDVAMDGPRPKITAQLSAGTIDVRSAQSGVPGEGEGAGAGNAASSGWSTAPIDVSGLAAVDADIGLSLVGLTTGRGSIGAAKLRLTLDRARAVLDIADMQAYGGGIKGSVVVNGRGGLSVRADLTLAGLAVQPMLSEMAGYDRLRGNGDLQVALLGVGNSQAEIMASLKGDGRVAFSQGVLKGLDILGMLRSLDAGYVGEGQQTIFDAVTAGFVIDAGVLGNDDLALTGPDLTATGAGQVGIGDRTLDYRLRPTALADADGTGGVMVPLLITGTWANPKFRLDLESIARERMEEEARALEEKARARAKELEAEAKAALEAKLKDELGVEVQDGENLKDAARRRAQEAMDDQAERLLQDLLGNEQAPVAGE
jgi:AsmA protein